jgi:hypothetical protein
MSAPNTKASKLERILRRQAEMDQKLNHITIPLSTIRVLTARVETLSRENAILMGLVGRMTLERQRLNAADERLEPEFGNRRDA